VGLRGIANSNATNSNVFEADRTFFGFGNNSAGTGWTSVGAPLERQILQRTFRVTEKGTDVTGYVVSIPDNSSILGAKLQRETSVVYLYVDTDTNFSVGATEYVMILSGTNWISSSTGIDFDDANFFTFGTNPPPAPG